MATIYHLAANTPFYFNSIGVIVSTDNVYAAFWRYIRNGENYTNACLASDFFFQGKLTYSNWIDASSPESIRDVMTPPPSETVTIKASKYNISMGTSYDGTLIVDGADNYEEFIDVITSLGFSIVGDDYPITYRLTNCTAPTAPIEAAVGDTVTVPIVFPEGYGVVNPTTDAYVTCNGVLVPATYSNGQLVFTMPDPS